jgi:aminoglycoside phosphotransferase family enzyme
MNFDDIPSDINPLGLFSKHAFQVAKDQVRLIQTHISWVILAGQYAYKLKKPVAFPFLD